MAMEGGAAEWFRRRERQGLGLTNVEGGGGGGDEGGGAAAGESGTSLWALEDEESEALGWDSFGRVMGLSSSEDLRCNALESLRDNPTSGESPRIVLRVETLRRRPRKYEFILPKIFCKLDNLLPALIK